jgi:5-methylcytosine-specific restriction endonuclease McrA
MPYADRSTQRRAQWAWMQRRRRSWLAANGPCVRCGSTEHLEVDHWDPASKVDHRVWSWSESRLFAELAKCQVLCRACHQRKTADENSRPLVHGVRAGYQRGCRCASCRRAHAEYRAQRRRGGMAA